MSDVRREPIEVSSAWEEHAYITRQHCACGGAFDWNRADLVPGHSGKWLEVVSVSCAACKGVQSFTFDVTDSVRGGNEQYLQDLSRAWPAPQEAPYAVDIRKYRAGAERIAAEMEAGQLNSQQVKDRFADLLNATHPLIAARYRVYGHRRGTMGTCCLCRDEGGDERPVVAKCVALQDRQDDDVAAALRREVDVWLRLGQHPNIVQLLDVVSQTRDSLIVVMDVFPRGQVDGRPSMNGLDRRP